MFEQAERLMLDVCAESLGQTIEDIQRAIRIPGVSKTGDRLDEMARWVGDYLAELGAAPIFHEGKIAPIVEAVATSGTSRGRLLFYTLYDVQPADPAEWASPPFEGRIVETQGRRHLIGRGAFNSKGPLVGFLSVVKLFRERGIPLPVDIHFVIEGEEEVGSPSLPGFILDNKQRLDACDGALIPYFGTDAAGRTVIRLGFNGLGFIELSVSGGDWGGPARQPVHSLHGGWLASPAWELVRALASLRSENGEFVCDGLETPDWWGADEDRMIAEAASILDAGTILSELGAERFRVEGDLARQFEYLLRKPTLNINAMSSGIVPDAGQPATQMPREARAFLDIRFVPGMDPHATIRRIREHLDRRGFKHVDMTVRGAYPGSRCDRRHPAVAAIETACRQHSGQVALLPFHSGAAPLYLFSEVAGLPYAFGGLGYGGKSHAPDEFLDVDSMVDYMRSMVSFLFRFAERL